MSKIINLNRDIRDKIFWNIKILFNMKILKNSPLMKLREMTVRGSIIRAIIYTCGHILIALTCNKLITNASFELATLDAIIEPIINGFWFYFLDRIWSKKNRKS